jgi:hypothetical protein
MRVFFSKLLMIALVLSAFAGCKDKDLPLEGVAGTYVGNITVTILETAADPIPNIPIVITYASANNVSLSIVGAILGLEEDITAICTVTSTEDSYSLTGKVSLENIEVPGMGAIPLTVTIKDSNISKSGKAVIKMEASVAGVPIAIMTINFDGQKQ